MTCAEVSRDMFEQDASWLWAGVGGAGEGNAVEMMVFVQVCHNAFFPQLLIRELTTNTLPTT